MIANERQYRVTRTAAREFEEALARPETVEAHCPPEPRRVMREAMERQLEELAEYKALRDGQVGVLELTSLAELPEAPIRARIAVNLTQKGLAERLGLKEQPVQRFEATQYAGAEPGPDPGGGRGTRDGEIHERLILPTASGNDTRATRAMPPP